MTIYAALEQWLTKIEIALIIFFVGFIIAKLASRIIKKLLAEAEINRILESAGCKPISNTIGTITQYIIYVITLLVILQQFGLTKLVLAIVFISATIVIIISLLLAIREFIPNFAAGIFVRKKLKPYLGKNIQIGTVKGKLKNYGLTGSMLVDKEEYYIPHLYTSKQKIKLSQAN